MSAFQFDTLFTFNSDPCYCNGRGDYSQCQALGFCVCNPGFTGRADFSNGHFSCHISNTVVIVLWSLVIAAVAVSYILSAEKVKGMINKFLRIRARMKKKGKSHSLNSHRGLTVVLILFFFVQPVLVTMAILRIVDDQQRVGLSIAFTILWTLLYIGFATASHRYTTAIATAMLRAEQSTNNYIARGRWFGRSLLIAQSFLTIFAYPVLINGGESKIVSRACMIAHLIWGVLVFMITGFWSLWVRKQTLVVLNDHPEHEELKRRMSGMLIGSARQAWVFAGIFFIVVCIPVLWTVHDYYEPLMLLSIPVLAVKATNSVFVPSGGGHGATTLHDNTAAMKQIATVGGDDPQSEMQSRS